MLNTTGFAVATPGTERRPGPFDACGRPVLQVVLAGGDEESWAAGMQGLSARDIAMNVGAARGGRPHPRPRGVLQGRGPLRPRAPSAR